VPAFKEPAKLVSPDVMEMGLLDEVLRLCPDATVTAPVPLAERVTPLAPDELELKVMPPLFAEVERERRPEAVMPPETVIAWSLVTMKLSPVLDPGPMVSGTPAPLLFMVTLPVVLAVTPAVEVAMLNAPLPEVRLIKPEVNVPAPDNVPDPFMVRLMLPTVFDPVDTLLLTTMPALFAVVVRDIAPPGVVVPSVIGPPTVIVFPAVSLTVAPTVEVIVPVFTVPEAVTLRDLVPKVVV